MNTKQMDQTYVAGTYGRFDEAASYLDPREA